MKKYGHKREIPFCRGDFRDQFGVLPMSLNQNLTEIQMILRYLLNSPRSSAMAARAALASR